MHKKILSCLLLSSVLLSQSIFAQDSTQYEDPNLPSAQYTPSYQTNNNVAQNIEQNNTQDNTLVQTINKNDLKNYCPYQFTRTLKQGDSGNDVKILQAILNSDSRTIITTQGPGSPNNETTLYGAATKDAVKRFQALFITPELGSYAIPIANGILGAKTRVFINAICNDDRFVTGNSSAQSIVSTPISTYTQTQTSSSVDNGNTGINSQNSQQTQVNNAPICKNAIPLKISLQANTRTVRCDADSGVCESFKIFINATQPISNIAADSIATTNGNIGDLRKLSSSQFLAIVTPTEKAKKIEIQIPADKITSTCGSINEIASNEVSVNTTLNTQTQTNSNTNTTTDNSASTTAMLAALNAQLDAAIKNIASTSATNSAQLQQLQQEKANLQTQLDQLKQQQNNQQNCYQGTYGTVCQNQQQQQASQQAQQNQDLMRALQGLTGQQNKAGQGSQNSGGGSSGGNSNGGTTGPGTDKNLSPQEAAAAQATQSLALAERICKLKPDSKECSEAEKAAAAALKTKHAEENSNDNPKSGEVLDDGIGSKCDYYKLDESICNSSEYDDVVQYTEGDKKFVVLFNIKDPKNEEIRPKTGQCSIAEFKKIASKIECFQEPACVKKDTIKREGVVYIMKQQVRSGYPSSGQKCGQASQPATQKYKDPNIIEVKSGASDNWRQKLYNI